LIDVVAILVEGGEELLDDLVEGLVAGRAQVSVECDLVEKWPLGCPDVLQELLLEICDLRWVDLVQKSWKKNDK